MNRIQTAAALAATALATATLAGAALWDPEAFTMEARKWQPAPSGHEVGKDDPSGALDASHHPGDDCGICHAPAGAPDAPYQPVARSLVFTITGTIYDGRPARRAVPGAELVLQDHAGNVISATSNDLGHFFTLAPIAPDPDAGDPAQPESWRYKAWIRAEGGERPMMTIPTVGGMTVPRMSCNMHHVNSGTLGAAWASPRPTVRSYPATGLSYRRHVFPILRTKCGPCHVPGPSSASEAGEAFDYGAGLDLLTYGGSRVELEDSTGAVQVYAKRGVEAVVNVSAPDQSLLFAKTVEGSVHGGGAFWTPSSADYQALRQWIAEGAQDN